MLFLIHFKTKASESMYARARAHTSPFFDQRIQLSFVSEKIKNKKIKDKLN